MIAKLRKIASALLITIISISGAKTMQTTSNWILDQYPKGWTCLRDVENFGDDLFYSPCDDESDKDSADTAMKPALDIKQTIQTTYERTLQFLPETGNRDLILSFLIVGESVISDYENQEAIGVFATLKNDFIVKHKPATMEYDEFIGKSIWNVQCSEIQKVMEQQAKGGDCEGSRNIAITAIDYCLNILKHKYQTFINTQIIPVLKQYSGTKHYLYKWGIE